MADYTAEEEIAREIVVFKTPDGGTFSNDPRWNDGRVREAWEEWQAAAGVDTDPEVEEEDDDPEDISYSDWTNDDLRAELSERKLSLDGKKADMVARLEEDDAKAEV